MFYKLINDNWNRGRTINLPDGSVLKEGDQGKDGWLWHDEEPQEYLDWKDDLELENLRLLRELENGL